MGVPKPELGNELVTPELGNELVSALMRIPSIKLESRFWQESRLGCFTASVIIAIFVGDLFACDVCLRLPGIPFESDHPAAIEVAMATLEAMELGQFELNPLVKQDLASDRYLRPRLDKISARQLVNLWSRTRPARNQPGLRFTAEIIFVDVEHTCRLDIRLGEVFEDDSRNGPADVRVFTTKAGFHRLLEVGLDHCESRKLVAIEAEDEQHRDGLARLFSISPNPKASTAVTSL